MNVSRMTRRIAVSGVATAIAAGALVGASSTTANAARPRTAPTRATSLGNPVDFPMHVDGADPAADRERRHDHPGEPAPGDHRRSPSRPTVASGLGTYGVTGGTIDDFGMLVGDTKAPAPLTFAGFTPNTEDGSLVASTLGMNTPFSLPAAGTYDITLPTAFTFMPTTATGPLPITVACTTATPAKLSSIRLDKNAVGHRRQGAGHDQEGHGRQGAPRSSAAPPAALRRPASWSPSSARRPSAPARSRPARPS